MFPKRLGGHGENLHGPGHTIDLPPSQKRGWKTSGSLDEDILYCQTLDASQPHKDDDAKPLSSVAIHEWQSFTDGGA